MRVEVGVDEVLEVREAVLRRHLEEAVGVLGVPVEVRSDVVGRDREGEDAPVGVAPGHHLDEGAIDEVHLRLELAVGEVHDLVADERVLLAQVVRARPVEGEVRERALAAPAARHIEVVDELLHALDDVLVGHRVLADEGRHVGVEGGERLRAGPLVLERAEEVDDLAARGGEVGGRCGGDRAGDAVEALLDEALERPSGAVAGEHVEVVDVVVAVAVGLADLGGVDLLEPVVRDDLARGVEDEAAEGVPLVGVGVDAPVGAVEVLLDCSERVDVVARGAIQGGLIHLIHLSGWGAWASSASGRAGPSGLFRAGKRGVSGCSDRSLHLVLDTNGHHCM